MGRKTPPNRTVRQRLGEFADLIKDAMVILAIIGPIILTIIAVTWNNFLRPRLADQILLELKESETAKYRDTHAKQLRYLILKSLGNIDENTLQSLSEQETTSIDKVFPSALSDLMAGETENTKFLEQFQILTIASLLNNDKNAAKDVIDEHQGQELALHWLQGELSRSSNLGETVRNQVDDTHVINFKYDPDTIDKTRNTPELSADFFASKQQLHELEVRVKSGPKLRDWLQNERKSLYFAISNNSPIAIPNEGLFFDPNDKGDKEIITKISCQIKRSIGYKSEFVRVSAGVMELNTGTPVVGLGDFDFQIDIVITSKKGRSKCPS